MARTRTLSATTSFGIWLESQMKRFEVHQKNVALRSGLGQSTVAGYLSGVRKPANPALVHRVVQGLLPEKIEAGIAAEVLHDALLAAGFAAPPLSPMVALMRELLDQCEECVGIEFPQPQIDILVDEIEDYARHRLSRTARHIRSQSQSQSQIGGGKQAQRQKQGAA